MNTDPEHRGLKRQQYGRRILIVGSLILIIGTATLALIRVPIHNGTGNDFWMIAMGMRLDGVECEATIPSNCSGNIYIPEDPNDHEWLGYTRAHYRGETLFRVSAGEAAVLLEDVVARLDSLGPGDRHALLLRGILDEWSYSGEPSVDSARELAAALKKIRTSCVYRDDIDERIKCCTYMALEDRELSERYRQARWYWAAVAFECFYLTWLLRFIVHPLRHGGALRWAVHVGLFPLLFLLPVYLGYSAVTFTAAFPRGGGVLYPFFLVICSGGRMTAIDKTILSYLPQVLEPLSTPIGPWFTMTGKGLPGPTTPLRVGFIAAVAVSIIRLIHVNRINWLRDPGRK